MFLAAPPLLFQISPAAPFILPIAVPICLLIAQRLPSAAAQRQSPFFGLLPVAYIPLQLAILVWAAHAVAAFAGAAALASLAVAVGVCMGVFGVLAAHEMIHSRERRHRWLGSALLTGMTYRHFRIAHLYGHHRYAATERDAATARLGESVYAFLARTLPAQWREAWRFERRRCRRKRAPLLRNALMQDVAVMLAVYVALLLLWGWRAAAFLAAESAVAILVLEAFNYVAHYGLVRRVRGGRLEPMAGCHSWNSGGAGDLLIFNMGRHSHHHRAPSLGYERLEPVSDAPALPGGYASAILLAFVPPLWRTIMDPRALAARGERESRYAPESSPATALS